VDDVGLPWCLKWWGGGIGDPRRPTLLHASCRSRARSSVARILRSPPVRAGRDFSSTQLRVQTKKPTLTDELLSLMVEVGGIEPPSASTLQIVLHT